MITWSKAGKKGVVSIGEGNYKGQPLKWFVTKSPGGMSYQLHLCEVKPTPMIARASIRDCQIYAEDYL